MSIAPSRPVKALREPPFYGPDGRYYPPSDIGAVPFDELPGHLELPRVGRGFFVNTSLDAERPAEVSRRLELQERLVEKVRRQADAEHSRVEQLAAKLRELGIDPDQLGT
jgi:hypothetical protein